MDLTAPVQMQILRFFLPFFKRAPTPMASESYKLNFQVAESVLKVNTYRENFAVNRGLNIFSKNQMWLDNF